METMGERIAKARMYMNLNQRELAKKANIAEPTLSRYENGYREPKAGTISQIAEALGISLCIIHLVYFMENLYLIRL